MEAEEVITLLDSYWFGKKYSEQPSSLTSSPDLKFEEKSSKQRILSQISRSLSDHLMISKTSLIIPTDSHSPDSVLYSSSKRRSNSEEQVPRRTPCPPQLKPDDENIKKKGLSKSLTELEYKELKGFMDLGFVFSEEDKKSNLVDIIPGLQRIGKEKEQMYSGGGGGKCSSISRPYLSESWKDLDIKKTRGRRINHHPLMNWRIPSPGNEIDMKDNLKWWAHTVASTVR